MPSCPDTVEPLQPGLELWVMPGRPKQVWMPMQTTLVAPAWPRSTPARSPRDREARPVGLGGLRERLSSLTGPLDRTSHGGSGHPDWRAARHLPRALSRGT